MRLQLFLKSFPTGLSRIMAAALLVGSLSFAIPVANTVADTQYPTVPHSNVDPGSLPKTDATTGGPGSTFGKVMSILFGIIAAFALLNIVLSGMKYITSAGNPQKTSEAKNGIVYSLVGLMIAISAEAIIAFVIDKAST